MNVLDIVVLVVLGLVAGVLSAVCGVGGGIVVVPALLWLRGMDVKVAVGTSLAYIVPTAAWGAFRKHPVGQVDWKIAAILAVGGLAGATIGAWAANELPAAWIKRIFALVLVGVAAKLFAEA